MSRFMRRQPAAGLVDNTTRLFVLPMYPCLQSITLYVNDAVVSSGYTFYRDTGTIEFMVAPSAQPVADYTAIQLTNAQITYYLWAGFQLMEALWSRKYLLSSSSMAYAMALPTDTAIYLCQGPLATGGTPSDPITGDKTFSTSPLQRAWLERCAEIAYLDSMAVESALSDVNVRERIGGVAITTEHRSRNIQDARKLLWDQMIQAMYAALDEYDSAGAHYGANATQIRSDYYDNVWDWQNNNGVMVPTGLTNWW
jgi:hypothetical protein